VFGKPVPWSAAAQNLGKYGRLASWQAPSKSWWAPPNKSLGWRAACS
jgi:hypothetical protein